MDNKRKIKNLALIGFMGTGKSSVGRIITEVLQYTFLDTDDLIEARTGKTIAEIFAQQGEPQFRELERLVVEELASRTKTVIATGGGLPVHGDNLEKLKSHSLTICLWSSPEKIYEQVRYQSHRPLLNDPNPLAKIRQLLNARKPFYRLADVLVNTERRSVREVAQQVIHQFRLAQAEHNK